MKRAVLSFVCISVLSIFMFQSCNRAEETGTLQFGLEEFIEDSQLKSATADMRPTEALVTIMDANGQIVYDKESLPLYEFGEALVTKSLKLDVGKYQLVEFMLVDSSGVILWATPKEGSPLAYLVRDPLPKNFGVSADETTKLPVEVVRVGSHPPSDFGYVAFDIHFVNRFCLHVFYSTRCFEDWNDSIMTADGNFAPVYQSRLIVWSGDRIILNEPMQPGLNKYSLPMLDGYYNFAATNCHGDTSYHRRFMLRELMLHRCEPNHQPLIIHDGMDPSIYVTPEGLTEPSINQGVFGMVTLPLIDSTNTEAYNFMGVVRDIYFFPYVDFDSLFFGMGPMGCLYQGPMPGIPVFISRSNSKGYFQASLEKGTYLYMVREQNGFFIDLYISSRIPGKAEVLENEITKLYIHMIDCSLVY